MHLLEFKEVTQIEEKWDPQIDTKSEQEKLEIKRIKKSN